MTGTTDRRLEDVADRAGRVLDEVERAVVGKRPALELALCAMLADGHVLIEDYPGLAKTLIARSFATVTGARFSRVQFTPDLMPSDVTGASIFNQRTSEFEFRPGPVFTNVLLADEINRAPPKTQAALLEAMQERQVTTEDCTRRLERPFLVLATQNPIEYEGTYPLPEAQLDRFLIRMQVGYPSAEDEWDMLARRLGPDVRDGVAEALGRQGIETRVYFPPVHRQPVFAGTTAELPVTDHLAGRILSLPIHSRLSSTEVSEVAAAVAAAVAQDRAAWRC